MASLVLGATASLRWLHKRPEPLAAWTKRLLQRWPARLVTVALANKLARIAWAIMTTGDFPLGSLTAPAYGQVIH
jgi:transposase